MLHRSWSRRRFLSLAGVAAASVPLLAHDLSSVAASGRAEADAAPVTLTFWSPNPPGHTCILHHQMAAVYERMHPNVRFSITCGTGSQDFLTTLLARIAAGNPPDAALLWDPPVTLAARGALTPLDSLMAHSPTAQKKNWPGTVLASCQWKGQTYGFPISAGSLGLWYNVDWFQKKGIPTERDKFPKTLDELRKLSKEFTYWKGDQLVSAGYIPLNDPDWPVMLFVWSALNGGQLFDGQKMKYTIDAEPNVALMDYMVSWLNEEYKGDLAAIESAGNWGNWAATNMKNAPNQFSNARLAMQENGSWWLDDQYEGATPKYKRYNVAQFPVGPGGTKTVSGYWPNWVAIPNGTHHLQEAFDWIDWSSSAGMLLWWHNIPDLPANKTVTRNLLPTVTTQKYGKAFGHDMMNFFYHQLDISIPCWNSPVQSFAQDQLQRTVESILRKQVSPKQGLAAAQQACQAQLAKVM